MCDRAANDELRVSFPDFPVKPESEYFDSCPKQGRVFREFLS